MIAEVYPIRRMPRRFSYFDYSIPESCALHIGDIVEIPFKGQCIRGVIREIKQDSSVQKLSMIQALVASHIFSRMDIQRLEVIAQNIYQSPSTIFHALTAGIHFKNTVYPYPRQKNFDENIVLNKDIAHLITNSIPFIKQGRAISIQQERDGIRQLLQWICAKLPHQILILTPNQFLAKSVTELLQASLLISGGGKSNPRSPLFFGWQKGALKILVGNRQASLLPAHKLSAVIILDSGSPDWDKRDRNPRYDARRAAELLAKQHGCSVISIGPMPALEEFARESKTFYTDFEPISILNRQAGGTDPAHGFLTDTLYSAIISALQSQKKVLLFYNRKGVADRLQCGICGHIPLCGTCGATPRVRENDLICSKCEAEMWIPEKCPSCSSPRMKKRGIGNKSIQSLLKKLFPEASIAISEKGSIQEEADILIATDIFFERQYGFDRKNFDIVADLTFDTVFFSNDFRSKERAAYRFHRLALFAKDVGAKAYLQTWMQKEIDQLIRLPDFIAIELKQREQYHLPPAFPMVSMDGRRIMEGERNNLHALPDDHIIEVDAPTYDQIPCSPSSK